MNVFFQPLTKPSHCSRVILWIEADCIRNQNGTHAIFHLHSTTKLLTLQRLVRFPKWLANLTIQRPTPLVTPFILPPPAAPITHPFPLLAHIWWKNIFGKKYNIIWLEQNFANRKVLNLFHIVGTALQTLHLNEFIICRAKLK